MVLDSEDSNGLELFENLERLSYDSIPDFDFRKLPQIKDIHIECTKKTPLNYFNIPRLQKLDIINPCGNDFLFLQDATELRALRIVDGSMKSMQGIDHLKNLSELKLLGMKRLEEIASLGKCSELESLEIDAPRILDFQPIIELKRLRFISIDAKNITINNFEWLNEMPFLEIAYLGVMAQGIDWEIIAGHPKLWDFGTYIPQGRMPPDEAVLCKIFERKGRKIKKYKYHQSKTKHSLLKIELEPIYLPLDFWPGYLFQGKLKYKVPIEMAH